MLSNELIDANFAINNAIDVLNEETQSPRIKTLKIKSITSKSSHGFEEDLGVYESFL